MEVKPNKILYSFSVVSCKQGTTEFACLASLFSLNNSAGESNSHQLKSGFCERGILFSVLQQNQFVTVSHSITNITNVQDKVLRQPDN